MMRRVLHANLVTALLLILFAETGVGQVGMQQMSGSPSGATANGNRPGGAGAAGSAGLTMVPEDIAKLRLAPGFMVNLNVLDDPDFAGTFRIDEEGNVALPILGTMHIAGETTPEARIQIQRRLLKDQILKDPQVTLTVVEYAPPEVTIIGEVNGPGKYPLLAPRKLVDVLALAGGTTIAASNEVQITQGDAGAKPVLVHYSRTTDASTVEDVIVHPGDTVQVKRAGIVYVLGAVTRPGGYVMQEEGTLNVLQAISLAFGTTTLASTRTVYLLRRNADGTVVYIALPFKKMTHGDAANTQLHATDILYVPTSTFKSIYSSTQQVINSAAVASIYVALGY
ncbi:MAG: polysaccharide biosynthesis/export family protein [Terracidiphilus sp.]|jgi:polysaccharide export outer membrane protein